MLWLESSGLENYRGEFVMGLCSLCVVSMINLRQSSVHCYKLMAPFYISRTTHFSVLIEQ